ncbi:MAG: class I tRNA ligase family protein, partial [Limnochordia bacterium]
VWQQLSEGEESVHLAQWPGVETRFLDEELAERWDAFFNVRKEVAKALELARTEKVIGSSNDAAVELYVEGEVAELLQSMEGELPDLFIVSGVELHSRENIPADALEGEEVAVLVRHAQGGKCPRCWKYYEEMANDVCHRCASALK